MWLDGEKATNGHYLVLLSVRSDRIVYADASLLVRHSAKMPQSSFKSIERLSNDA